MKYRVEYTDTFGGEANYSWCKRATLDLPNDASNRMLVRKAKAAIDLTGILCKREMWGEIIVLRPRGSCTIVFISPEY